MIYTKIYHSPLSPLTLVSDGEYLTALCFPNGRDYEWYISPAQSVATQQPEYTPPVQNNSAQQPQDLPVFTETVKWLNLYFNGQQPDFFPKIKRPGETPFRRAVAEEMLKIPYGETRTYGDIATAIAHQKGLPKMSAQAVGGAVGWNPICIIIPCHRVVSTNRSLTGYGGGIKNKIALLQHEGIDLTDYIIPTAGTAL